MRKSLYKILWIFLGLMGLLNSSIVAQTPELDRLQIHHIFVNDGDCTAIVLFNKSTKEFDLLALIDAGGSSYDKYLTPYLNIMFGGTTFDYIIGTHYHDDHLHGFEAMYWGNLLPSYVIDPGGYDDGKVSPNAGTNCAGIMTPVYTPESAGPCTDYASDVLNNYMQDVKTACLRDEAPRLKRSTLISMYPDDLGREIELAEVDGVPITLKCVAGNGWNLSSNPTPTNNRDPNRENPNNFSLAFVVEYGEFRYYVGGDLGGSGGTNCGSYIDQETSLAGWFPIGLEDVLTWDKADTVEGHICTYQSNHHGSLCSSNSTFLRQMRPTAVVTTAHPSSSIPSSTYVQRLIDNLNKVGDTLGMFFSYIREWSNGDDVVDFCEDNVDGKYIWGYGDLDDPYTWMIEVDPNSFDITTESRFRVLKSYVTNVGGFDVTPVYDFKCHFDIDVPPDAKEKDKKGCFLKRIFKKDRDEDD